MNTPEIFKFEQNEVRTLLINDEPFFVGKDVAEAIGYKNYRDALNKHVKQKYKRVSQITTTSGVQEMTIISEPGLYQIASESKLPSAEPFQDWVYEDVLPAIRKYGMYAKEELLDDPDLMIEVLTKYKEEKALRIETEQKNTMLQQTVDEYEPKINYLDIILGSEDTVTVSQIAQDYGMTPNQLNKLLNELKVQYKVNKQWILTKKYKGQGFVKSKTFEVPKKEGGTKVVMDTRWTQKGRIMLYDLLKAEGYYPQIDLDDIA